MAASPPPDPLSSLGDAELLARLPAAAGLPDAPAGWQQRALAAWRTGTNAKVPPAEALQALRERILAVLSFDSWGASPLTAGLRSTGSATRQLVFSAEGRDIDLRIVPSGQRFAVSGQVLGPDERGAVVLSSGQTSWESALDDFGEFRLTDVAPGRYRLMLMLTRQEIELPAFDIGQQEDGAG